MAMTLSKRKRSRRDPAPARSLGAVAQAERAAMTALAETLRRLAGDLPDDSMLAAEFASVARSIDVVGVVGTWRLNELVPGTGEDTESAPPQALDLTALYRTSRPGPLGPSSPA